MNRPQRIIAIIGVSVALIPALFPLWNTSFTLCTRFKIKGEREPHAASQKCKDRCRGFLFVGPWVRVSAQVRKHVSPPPRDDMGARIHEYYETQVKPAMRDETYTVTDVHGVLDFPKMLLEVGVIIIPMFILVWAFRTGKKEMPKVVK